MSAHMPTHTSAHLSARMPVHTCIQPDELTAFVCSANGELVGLTPPAVSDTMCAEFGGGFLTLPDLKKNLHQLYQLLHSINDGSYRVGIINRRSSAQHLKPLEREHACARSACAPATMCVRAYSMRHTGEMTERLRGIRHPSPPHADMLKQRPIRKGQRDIDPTPP